MQRRTERGRLTKDDLHLVDRRRGTVHQPAAGDRAVVDTFAGLGVAPVDHLVLLERGIESDVEQASLPAGVDGRQPRHRLRHLLSVGADDPQPAGLLGHQHAAVGQERQPPRVDQAFGDRHHVERDAELLLGRARLPGKRRLLPLAIRRTGVHPRFRAASGRSATAPSARRRCRGRLRRRWRGLLCREVENRADGQHDSRCDRNLFHHWGSYIRDDAPCAETTEGGETTDCQRSNGANGVNGEDSDADCAILGSPFHPLARTARDRVRPGIRSTYRPPTDFSASPPWTSLAPLLRC